MIEVAGINVRIDNRFDKIREKCKDYLISNETMPDITIRIPDDELFYAQDYVYNESGEHISLAEAEALGLHMGIYKYLYPFDALRIHGVAIERNGKCYIFTAPSGYGKTTHARLWLNAFHDARIINGDNPILRLIDGVFYVYGTPFCGKEGYQVNTCVPLGGICYLERAEHNRIRKMDSGIAFAQLIKEYGNQMKTHFDQAMRLYELLAEKTPVYRLSCNQEREAAVVAYEGML